MIKTFLFNRRGSVSLFAVIVIPVLLGIVGLAVEYGFGLLQRVEDQRVADLAAYAAATAYNANSSVSVTTIADNVANLNGVATSNVMAALVTSPTGSGNQAVQVVVQSPDPLHFSRILGRSPVLTVSAIAYAELKAGAPPCIIALDAGGSGVTVSGGAQLTANQCAVSSNAAVTVPNCYSSGKVAITTLTINYNSSSTPDTTCNKIAAPSGKSLHLINTTTNDPLKDNSSVTDAVGRITTVANLKSPSASGTNISFDYNSSTVSSLPSNCQVNSSFNSKKSTRTVQCTAGNGNNTFNFGSIYVQGGLTVNISGPASATYNIGSSNTSCGTYSICMGGGTALTFSGPSSFVLAGGIDVGGSSSVTLGGGSPNSYQIGSASGGYAVNLSGSSSLILPDTGTSMAFQVVGNISTAGGSCFSIPAASEHDINGSIDAVGGIYLGAGLYTVNGYVSMGGSGGNDVANCPTTGVTTGLTGIGVTLVVSGSSTITCNGLAAAFCIGAGYSTVTLTAPATGGTAGLAVIGPQSSGNTAAAVFTAGASNTRISGTFYFPNGPISLSGAAQLEDTQDSNACLELIGSYISVTGGSAAGSSCISGSGASSTVALVQ